MRHRRKLRVRGNSVSQRSTDPRSPVQAERNQWWLPLIVAAIAAVAVWNWRQPDERPLPSSPLPAPVNTEVAQRAEADLVRLFSADDYPQAAIRREEQGTVAYRLEVNTRGRVSDCQIVKSSGSSALDRATCSILQKRARFDPALDGAGRRVPDQYEGRIRWELPQE